MDVDKENPVVQRLEREPEELRNIVSSVTQSNWKDASNDSDNKTSSTNSPKKKTTNEGSASCAGSRASRHSSPAHGTLAREQKRKTGRHGEDGPSKEDKQLVNLLTMIVLAVDQNKSQQARNETTLAMD